MHLMRGGALGCWTRSPPRRSRLAPGRLSIAPHTVAGDGLWRRICGGKL